MSNETRKPHVLVAVTGSIAAYKSCELVREFIKKGAEVKVVLTKNVEKFVHKNTFDALTHNQAYDDLFDDPMLHITLAKWADVIVIAPATASIISQLAHGMAGDLLTTVCLATKARCFIAPAMNKVMWDNPATTDNIAQLRRYGYHFLLPGYGEQACGDVGYGRMVDPEEIAHTVFNQPRALQGIRVAITAGPTQEKIDPVRYLGNFSSGKMGYALAELCWQQGGDVTLISGPTDLDAPMTSRVIAVKTADEMLAAVMKHASQCDLLISAAAVADYKVKTYSTNKIKKTNDAMTLELVKTTDILATVTAAHSGLFTVGFCAETENLIDNAKAKLQRKHLQAIIANQVSEEGYPFGADSNEVVYLNKQGAMHHCERNDKKALANTLLELIMQDYNQYQEIKTAE